MMISRSCRLWLAAIPALALLLVGGPGPASGGERLPFSDDPLPPSPLPVPLDRYFKGEFSNWDGERITLRWDWSSEEQLLDFDPYVPVRSGLRGGFTWKEGQLQASGTGGVRLRLGMKNALELSVTAKLIDPHDLGVVLALPGSSDQSVLCLLQDRFFTDFDAAAGNSTMINKLGGIPATAPGVTEFRYVSRSGRPKLARGDQVRLDVKREDIKTTFVIAPEGEDEVSIAGKDTDDGMIGVMPGLYVSGGAADFGPLEVTGAIDKVWCELNDVLPHVAGDLTHKGNRFKGKVLKAAKLVMDFLGETAETPEKKRIKPAKVAALVGQEGLPLVIRIRAAEALMEKGANTSVVVDRIAELLDAKDRPARVLAWQVLRAKLPWHFRYDPDGDTDVRREAALLVGSYFRERDDQLAGGKVFVDGYWYTPSRADAVREDWEKAWDLRSDRVRLRTNVSAEWAYWYFDALEAAYASMFRLTGQEPEDKDKPISVFVFKNDEDYDAFCKANGYERSIGWGRFVDLEKDLACVSLKRDDAPFWAIGQMAKVYLRGASGVYWPGWYQEGRSAFFGNPTYGTGSWDGTELRVGLQAQGLEAQLVRAAANAGDIENVATFLARDPRKMDGQARRRWYVQAWALYHWLLREAPDDIGARFARWQAAMVERDLSPREVDVEGRRLFMSVFAGKMRAVDTQFLAWLKTL